MKNLDDFMRQKFNTDPDASGDRFEFREEYWEQAQALLEAEEARRRKRRRRRWLLWWVFSGAIAVAVAVYSGSGTKQEADLPAVGTKAEGSGKSSGDAPSLHSVGTGDIQAQGGDTASGFVSGEKMPGADSVFLKNKIENQGFILKSEAGKGRSAPSSAPSQKTQARQGRGVLPGQKTTGRQGREGRAGQEAPELRRGDILPGSKSPAQREGQIEQAGRISADSSSSLDMTAFDKSDKQNDLNDLNAPNSLNDNFPQLPTLLLPIKLLSRKIDAPEVTPFARRIEPVHERRFSFGLSAAASLSQPSPDGRRIGGAGGASANYRLNQAWSLTASARWRFLPGDWGGDSSGVETSEQLRYGFGYQHDVWSMETRGLHFLELPFGLQWRRGAFSAEGGVAPGFLLGVQGRLTQRHTESLQTGERRDRSTVWLDKGTYRRFYIAPFLGAGWRATKHLGLAAQGFYRPGSLAKSSDANSPGGGWWLDLGLRWHF